jgi:uncharacterized membrane protein
LDQKDSFEEILRRLKSIDHRLNSIEKFLGEEKKEIVEEEPLREELKEPAYAVSGEKEEEKKQRGYEEPEGKSEKREIPVAVVDQEKIWINVLHKIGLVAIILGVGLFIKYSLPYIGLWGRIAIGLLIGTSLLYAGERLMKGYGTYALGVSSSGIVILYFSFYAASAFYNLINPVIAFVMMVLVTILGVLLSLRYDNSVISFIAILGAFLTPYVFRGGEITPLALIVLFSYLALINLWILIVTKIKEWKLLNILAFSLTAMMVLTTIRFSSESGYPWVFLIFSTIFFALFFYIPKKENTESLIILFLNPFLYYFVLWFITYKINPYIAGTLALMLSAFYYYEGSRIEENESLDIAWSFSALAICFLTIAVPVFFKAKWSTFAWAIEGAAILSLGRKEKVLTTFPVILLGIAVFKMFFIDYISLEFLPFFINSVIVIICVLLSAKFLSKIDEEENKGIISAFSILGLILVFWFTVTGAEKFFDKFSHLKEMESLSISFLWGVYALVLFLVGIIKRSSPARIAGFIMASLTIIKVFLYDLSYLEARHRVLSLVVLGIILLIISFIYQKKIGRQEENE